MAPLELVSPSPVEPGYVEPGYFQPDYYPTTGSRFVEVGYLSRTVEVAAPTRSVEVPLVSRTLEAGLETVGMANLAWEAPFDPQEKKDYVVDWTEEMVESGDTLSTVTVTPDAVLATNGVVTDAGTVVVADHAVVIWFDGSASGAQQTNLIAASPVEVHVQVVTTGGRRLERTCELTVEAL